jgi:hypothetical protein
MDHWGAETRGRHLPSLLVEPGAEWRLPTARAPSGARPSKPRRSLQTTNTERILADLESDVINGMMMPREADKAFGCKPTGSGGRRRKSGQETFAAWLHTRIAKLSDPDGLAALVRDAQRLQTDRTIRPAKRIAAVREFNRKMVAHDPDYVDQLRNALAEIEAPLSAAA